MPSRTPISTSPVEEDLRLRDAILAGDDAAWHRFVNRYSDWAVETAIRWSDSGCRVPGGCSLKRGPGRPFRRFLDGDCRCDRVGGAYYFLLEKLREKLAFYRGDRGCRLDTWVRHLLIPNPRHSTAPPGAEYGYRQLYADYLRKFEGRVRAPAEILRDEPLLEQIYVQFHYGKDEAAIREALGLTPAQMDAAVERIEELLRRKGADFYWRFWAHLWIPRQTESLSPFEEEAEEVAEPAAAGTDPHTGWEAAAIQSALADSLAALPALTRHLLWLAIDRGMTAPQIAVDLQARDLARWSQRQVYAEIDRALARLCEEVSRRLVLVDEVTIRPREMKNLLEFWSVERFLNRRESGTRTAR